MRAQFINEKFEEKSDPIHDLGIGGIDLEEVYNQTIKKGQEEWRSFFNSLIGKKIMFTRSAGRKITGIVKSFRDARFTNDEGYIYVKLTNKEEYSIDASKKIYVE